VLALAMLSAAATLAAAAPAPVAETAATKRVTINDNYYGPAKLKVRKGTTIAWVWPDIPVDVHDVKLKKGPKGVKRFWSDAASSSYTYKRKLKVPGTYSIICTLHEEMAMTIRVKTG